MAKKIYARAKHIIALSPGMKEGIICTGVPADKVTVIPNGSDLDLFSPDIDGSVQREQLRLKDRLKIQIPIMTGKSYKSAWRS